MKDFVKKMPKITIFFGLRRPEIPFSHYFVSENIFELLCLIFCVLNVQKLFRINENPIICYENYSFKTVYMPDINGNFSKFSPNGI